MKRRTLDVERQGNRRRAGAPSGPRQRALRREKILASLRDLIRERRTLEISIDEVAERAQVAKGTIYHYFDSRSRLIRELIIFASEKLSKNIIRENKQRRGQKYQYDILSWCKLTVSFLCEAAYTNLIIINDGIGKSLALRDFPPIIVLSEILTKARRDGGWPRSDPMLTAIAMFRAICGLVEDAETELGAQSAVRSFVSECLSIA